MPKLVKSWAVGGSNLKEVSTWRSAGQAGMSHIERECKCSRQRERHVERPRGMALRREISSMWLDFGGLAITRGVTYGFCFRKVILVSVYIMGWRGQDWRQSDKLGCCCSSK